MEWISVEDRLPEKHQDVLVFTRVPDCIFTATWFPADGVFKASWGVPDACYETRPEYGYGEALFIENPEEITHWRPLPDPPDAA